ncbi:MAG: hypothetical protein ACM31L_20020, partial [Actinomycetota bacterium]
MRALMEAWTRRLFRLARGGEQHGHDMMSGSILVECKRYAEGKKPETRELMGELAQALVRFPTLDLFVVVATTEIGSNTLADIRALADQHAVELLVVDWHPDAGGDLPVLCARFPEVTRPFLVDKLGADPGLLDAALNHIRARSDFSACVSRLTNDLSKMLFGYAHARQLMADWLRSRVRQRAAARTAFGQDLALRERDVRLIRRDRIFADLDEWWRDRPGQPFSLVGEEGSGKSWAAMAWLLELLDRPDCPLVIPVTSNMVQGPDKPAPARIVVQVLMDALGRALIPRSETWWHRRAQLWWQQDPEPARPLVLFLLDGLNEAPHVAWRQFIGATQIDDNIRHNAVVLTCRKPYWDEYLAPSGRLPPPLITEGYETEELRQAVGDNFDWAKVPADLLPLMRRPRYCRLVVDHFAAMLASGDFTIARLLFEDSFDRQRARESPAFTAQEFNQVLGRLAHEHWTQTRDGPSEATFDKPLLSGLLPHRDDLRALQELLDSGVLVHLDDPARPYRVEGRRLVYGLGMLLAHDLRRIAAGHGDAVERWFEPQRDMDMKTEILGAAVFFTLPALFPSYPAAQRRALLWAWLVSRNMPAEQEAAVIAYLPDCAEDLLAISDDFFAPSDAPVGGAVVRLGKALAARRHSLRVLPHLQMAATRWAGYVRQEKNGSRWTPPATRFGPFTMVPFNDLRGPGLQVFAAAVIQAGPRMPFVPAMIRTALSAGFIHEDFTDGRIDWCFRLTDEDLAVAVDGDLMAIKAAGGAGHVLLCRALGFTVFPAPTETAPSEGRFVDGDIDDDVVDACLNPCDQSGMVWAGKVREKLATLSVDERIVSPLAAQTDFEFERIEPIAAAHAAHALGLYLVRLLASLAERNPKQLKTIGLYLPEMMAVAGPNEWAALVAVRGKLAQSDDSFLAAEARTYLALTMCLPANEALDILLSRADEAYDIRDTELWFRPRDDDEAAAIHLRLETETEPRRLFRVLSVAACAPRPLTAKQRTVVARCLCSGDDDLRYAAARYVLVSRDRGLADLALHDNRPLPAKDGHLADRLLAAVLIRHGRQLPFDALSSRLSLPDTASAVAERGCMAGEVDDLFQTLKQALADLPTGSATGATPVIVAEIAGVDGATVISYSEKSEERPRQAQSDRQDWEQLARILRGDDADEAAENRARHERFRAFISNGPLHTELFPVEALRAIHARHGADVHAWAAAACAPTPEGRHFRAAASGFLQSLAAALAEDAPALGFRLWRTLRDEGVSPRFLLRMQGSDWMACLPFQATDTPDSQAARQAMLDQAITDQEFLELATIAHGCGRRDWLMDQIHAHLRMRPLWRRGKGLALAAVTDLDDAEYEGLVRMAGVEGTWVGEGLPTLRRLHD